MTANLYSKRSIEVYRPLRSPTFVFMKNLILAMLILLPTFAFAEVRVSFWSEITPRSLASLEKKILKAVRKMKEGEDRSVVVDLSSGGGNLFATMRFITHMKQTAATLKFSLHTRVKSSCESACTVLYTMGEERRASKRAQFGFHSPKVESRLPRGVSRKEVLEHARARWIGAIAAVDPLLASELELRKYLFDEEMAYLEASELLSGYVTHYP